LLKTWFVDLDLDEVRGADSLGFVQFVDPFAREGLLRLDDVSSFDSAMELRTTFPGILNIGTARRLLKYAKEDAAELIRKAKRARVAAE
jgi:hypothetical protein